MDVSDVLRVGQVSSVNPVNGSCRVVFDDLDEKVTGELQILQRHTDKAKHFSLPEEGEHVLCAFLPNGSQEGFVLGSNYTAYNLPKDGEVGVYRIEYDDGTIFEYDRNTHTATVRTEHHVVVEAKDVKVTAEEVSITAPRIQLVGQVSVQGNVEISGNLNASGSVMDAAGNSNHHEH